MAAYGENLMATHSCRRLGALHRGPQWRTTDSRITCGGETQGPSQFPESRGTGDPPTRTFPSVLVLGAGRSVFCERAVPTVGERERGVRGAAD